MPEGHSIRRLATMLDSLFTGAVVRASSPQGRFAAGAEAIDGWRVTGTGAHGKHLFVELEPPTGGEPRFVHVHLGLYGAWSFVTANGFAPHAIGAPRRPAEGGPASDGTGAVSPGAGRGTTPGGVVDTGGDDSLAVDVVPSDPMDTEDHGYAELVVPEPRPTVRLRLLTDGVVADLTGPARCDLIDEGQKDAVHERLGPDPLRPDADPDRFVAAVRRTRRGIGELLMDQSVIAGVGNIYRAEALYRARIHPRTEGRAVSVARLRAMWDDVAGLLADGVEHGVIVTTRPEDRRAPRPDSWARAAERATDEEADFRWYVYRRAGRACHVCGQAVSIDDMAGRTVFWCGKCQRLLRSRARAA
ncbi:Fpg/Nei family DNA glycosylase [Georgenia sp. Z1344]|uniref:Fpg/Nei family DNA glycosylase n=1 Tax=Georgenia sp. Z1344 TaxID=3416706 RepID=UPI003CF16016